MVCMIVHSGSRRYIPHGLWLKITTLCVEKVAARRCCLGRSLVLSHFSVYIYIMIIYMTRISGNFKHGKKQMGLFPGPDFCFWRRSTKKRAWNTLNLVGKETNKKQLLDPTWHPQLLTIFCHLQTLLQLFLRGITHCKGAIRMKNLAANSRLLGKTAPMVWISDINWPVGDKIWWNMMKKSLDGEDWPQSAQRSAAWWALHPRCFETPAAQNWVEPPMHNRDNSLWVMSKYNMIQYV